MLSPRATKAREGGPSTSTVASPTGKAQDEPPSGPGVVAQEPARMALPGSSSMALAASAPSTSKDTASSSPKWTGKDTGSDTTRVLVATEAPGEPENVTGTGAEASEPSLPARATVTRRSTREPSPERK